MSNTDVRPRSFDCSFGGTTYAHDLTGVDFVGLSVPKHEVVEMDPLVGNETGCGRAHWLRPNHSSVLSAIGRSMLSGRQSGREAVSRRVMHRGLLSGTKPPFAGAAIAYAAFLHTCGKFFAAMQLLSPNRPLNFAMRRRIQTVLSLHSG